MSNKWIAAFVVVALLVATYLARAEYNDVLDRNRRLALDSATWTEQIGSLEGDTATMREAYFALALEARSERELRKDAEDRAGALFRRAERLEAQVTGLTTFSATLSDSLRQLATVLRGPDTIRVAIDVLNQYERGSVGVKGNVNVPTIEGDADVRLEASARLDSLAIMLTRMPDLTLQCGIDTGVEFLEIANVACNQLAPLEDDLVQGTRRPLLNFGTGLALVTTVGAFIAGLLVP